jgi:cyclic pyranopterin phosphate synthase
MGIPVIAFAAWSGTGKTTLIEKLVAALKARGLRVAVVKHDAHRFEIDRAGKDSWRFTQAGADVVLISSPEKTAMVAQRPATLRELLGSVRDVDLILVEGYKNEDLPQIGVSRAATGKGLPADPSRYLAVVTDEPIKTDRPVFAPDDIGAITRFILEAIHMTEPNEDFTHFNDEGRAKMVDVGDKPTSRRTAVAAGRVLVNAETFARIRSGGMKKGDVLTVAQVAGVMGAKRTSELIPMCHPVAVDGIDLHLSLREEDLAVEIRAEVRCDGRTGVEMEALTAVSVAALTVYDMCKAVQKDIVISDIRLMEKHGGVRGDFYREES